MTHKSKSAYFYEKGFAANIDSEREAVLKQIGAKREKVRKKEDTAWVQLR